jgi:hypothetical protein
MTIAQYCRDYAPFPGSREDVLSEGPLHKIVSNVAKSLDYCDAEMKIGPGCRDSAIETPSSI